jgi:hypothetical protein
LFAVSTDDGGGGGVNNVEVPTLAEVDTVILIGDPVMVCRCELAIKSSVLIVTK